MEIDEMVYLDEIDEYVTKEEYLKYLDYINNDNFQTNTWTTDSGEQYDTNGDLIEGGSQMDIGDKKILQECKKIIAGVILLVSC